MLRLWRRNRTETTTEESGETRALSDELAAIFGAFPAASGIAVTPASAMKVPAVAAATGVIAGTVATLPAKVFERLDEGGKEPDTEHPAYRLVHDEANPWTSAGALREAVTRDAMLHNRGGFALAVRARGRVAELHRLDPNSVTVEQDETTAEPLYRVRQSDQSEKVHGWRDVIHIQAPGGAPIVQAREAIGLALILERHCATFFGKGGRPDGILTTEGKLGSEVIDRIRTAWRASFGGQSGGTPVLEQGLSYKPVTFNSVDSQLEQMRQFQILEISRAFRVPPQFLSDLSRATWSNAEEMNRAFLQYCLLGWLRAWEAAYRRVLLPPEDRQSRTVEFVVSDLLRGDTKSRAESYAKMIASRVMTPNEARAFENLPAHPDGDRLENPNTTAGGTDDE